MKFRCKRCKKIVDEVRVIKVLDSWVLVHSCNPNFTTGDLEVIEGSEGVDQG